MKIVQSCAKAVTKTVKALRAQDIPVNTVLVFEDLPTLPILVVERSPQCRVYLTMRQPTWYERRFLSSKTSRQKDQLLVHKWYPDATLVLDGCKHTLSCGCGS